MLFCSGRRCFARAHCGRLLSGLGQLSIGGCLLAAACGRLLRSLPKPSCVHTRLDRLGRRTRAVAGCLCRLVWRLSSWCVRRLESLLDLEFCLAPMILGPSFAAAFPFPDFIGARSDALFLVAHSSTPIEPVFPGHSAGLEKRVSCRVRRAS